ncbi:hypothetical protein [Sphingosinicella sp. CPCC 101087]|nr:hypothetical protein [Sphingosinicella sp. CPCC 101087]
MLIALKRIGERFVHIPIWAARGASLLIVGGTIAISLAARRRPPA